MALRSGTRLGPYEIQSPLGAGGMGEVYLARQSSLDRQVAIKVLASSLASDPERMRRFEREACAASALNHPNIISIYDVGRENTTTYIAMEFVDGRTLRALMELAPLTIKKALQIATQIADGLAKAHTAGIVHRDLKPENIMVTRDGFVKILDFGLAKLMPGLESSSQATIVTVDSQPGAVVGTAPYMSPEQARGATVDYRSDIFSLGSILYEMLTCKKPFKGESTVQTLTAIIEDDPLSLAEANPKAPMPLRWVVERCLAKDPEERYNSTLDLARDLKSIRDHLSSTTTSGSLTAVPSATTNPKWVTTAALVLLGMILGAVLILWLRPSPRMSAISLHPLTFSGNDFMPSVSPDGKTVAFVSGRDGPYRIWLKQLEGGGETVLTPGPDDQSPRFSPDGAWVMFIHNHAAYRIPSIGGQARKLLDNVEDAGWSPDGRQVAFVRYDGAETQIGVASIADGSSRVIHRVENMHLLAPSWSPDGSTMAFIPQTTGTAGAPSHSFTLASPDGQSVRQLVCPFPGGELSTPSWIDGGKRILYALPESAGDVGTLQATTVGSASRIFSQDVKSGEVHALFSVQAPVSRIEVAGIGRVIFDTVTQRDNLKLFSTDRSELASGRWLTRGNSIDRQPYFSADGDAVVFSSSRSGDVDLWEVSFKSGALQRLTDHPASDWDPYVTLDNKHLLWSSNRTGNFEIWMADRDGSSPRQISHDGVDAENPVSTPDGSWVVYASGQLQHPGVWKVRVDGTDSKQLVSGPAAWPDVSPDGKYLLYHVVNGALHGIIHVIRLEDGAPVDFQAEGIRTRFLRDGHSVVYILPNGRDIVRQNFLSGQGAPAQVLVPASQDFVTDTFHITPDGKHIIVAYAQPSRGLVIADDVPGIRMPTGAR
jgi:serine/threonine protein kinase